MSFNSIMYIWDFKIEQQEFSHTIRSLKKSVKFSILNLKKNLFASGQLPLKGHSFKLLTHYIDGPLC